MRTYLCRLVMGVLTAAMSLGCAAEPLGSEKASARGEVDPRGYRDIGGDTEHWEGGEFTPQHAVVDASKPDHERDAGVKPPKDKDAGPPPKKPGRCWVTGGGQIDGETFGGNAKPFRDGSVDGEWNHVDHQGNHFHGDPTEIITCDVVDGPGASPPQVEFNRIIFEGVGTWTELGGASIPVTFRVVIEDHGEPGRLDEYTLTVFSGTTVIHSVSGVIDRGNLQIHPSNPGHP